MFTRTYHTDQDAEHFLAMIEYIISRKNDSYKHLGPTYKLNIKPDPSGAHFSIRRMPFDRIFLKGRIINGEKLQIDAHLYPPLWILLLIIYGFCLFFVKFEPQQFVLFFLVVSHIILLIGYTIEAECLFNIIDLACMQQENETGLRHPFGEGNQV